MMKMKIKKFDYLIWAVLLLIGVAFYFTQQYLVLLIAIPFLIFYGIILFLRLLIFSAGKPTQIHSDDIHPHKINTSGWIKSRAKIIEILPSDEIINDGKVIARFVGFKLKIEKYDGVPMIHELFINNVITPISKLQSMGINTEVQVLLNPKNKYVGVFDPQIETWIQDLDE